MAPRLFQKKKKNLDFIQHEFVKQRCIGPRTIQIDLLIAKRNVTLAYYVQKKKKILSAVYMTTLNKIKTNFNDFYFDANNLFIFFF